MSSRPITDETTPLIGEADTGVASAGHVAHDQHVRRLSSARPSAAFQIAAAMYSFVVLGVFSSSVGVVLPHISRHYDLSDLHVSLIFLAAPIGYIIAAQSNAFIHATFGKFGVAVLGPIFHILSAVGISAHPAFYVVLLAVAFTGMGTGLLDGSYCAWAATMENANTVSGLLQGSFSTGAAAGPFLADAMMSAETRPWYQWYYVLAGASVIELLALASAFRKDNAARYHRGKGAQPTGQSHGSRAIFRHRATWLSAAYFLAYVGTETAISGWIVSFMGRALKATPYQADVSLSGFWTGMAIGRFFLGAVADKIGVRLAAIVYLVSAITLEMVFTVLQTPVVSIVLVTLLGFFMGPLFPSGVVELTRLLPIELHVAGVSFGASIGQIGAAVFPFGIGAIIHGFGIGVFRLAILVLTIFTLTVWMVFSGAEPRTASLSDEEEEHGE